MNMDARISNPENDIHTADNVHKVHLCDNSGFSLSDSSSAITKESFPDVELNCRLNIGLIDCFLSFNITCNDFKNFHQFRDIMGFFQCDANGPPNGLTTRKVDILATYDWSMANSTFEE